MSNLSRPSNYDIMLLGRFAVVRDGEPVGDAAWSRRHAASLVKLLALAPSRRLHREQVIDALWPDQSVEDAAPRLHKAAHFARRALGGANTVVLRGENVSLLPDADVRVDAVSFERAAEAGLRAGDVQTLADAAAAYTGDLLPIDIYDEWLDARRQHLRMQQTDVLRQLGRWEDLVALDATDEEAHLQLMQSLAAEGDIHGALRQFERLDKALATELGVGPGAAARALRDQVLAQVHAAPTRTGPSAPAQYLLGRERECDALVEAVAAAAQGRGQTILCDGVAGIGKTALLAWVRDHAASLGFRTGSGTAAAIEGNWAYAAVLEALADLCRRQPALLDGLDDIYRYEIDRALAGTDLAWTGEGGHQRLFVAVAELLRLASADRGAILVLDDLHEADEATLRLLHYIARCATGERIAVVIAFRTGADGAAFEQLRQSLVSRAGATTIQLEALDDHAAAELVRATNDDLDTDEVARIVGLGAGVPFALAELARRDPDAPAWGSSIESVILASIGPATRDVLQRVAVLGASFDTDEFVAVAEVPDEEAFSHLDRAIDARILEHTGSYYRFRHGLVRDALLADIAPHRLRGIHRDAATRLESEGAPPLRIGHHLVAAGDPRAAAPFLLRAAEREAAIGAYRDALSLIEQIHGHADGDIRARALARRADLLFALGDPDAPLAFRHALEHAAEVDQPLLRARLARASTTVGDLATAVAALDGVELDGGPADAEILLARGNLAFFSNDLETAWSVSEEAQRKVLAGDKNWQVLELVALQGLLAHTRGEWFDRMRVELQRTRQNPEVALAIFDGYLCPAEYLLYGPMPYADVIELARSLRHTAHRAGALRAVAFACALAGEAALLAGDLEVAQRELQEAVDLHHDIGAAAGEAHSLQRLAEVRLAQGDRDEATRLLQRALPLARWSMISMHLLQRIFGTLIVAAPDAAAARAMVDRAESTLGTDDACIFCHVMLAVPATIACAQVGDLEHAHRHLEAAGRSVARWDGTSWQAALLEARAHVVSAEGDEVAAAALRREAVSMFDAAGQPLDAARLRAALPAL
ncbi:MAG TPA: AAA family ATPase [Acidimicrobiales bacterium]|nr:AAA family ATPase [Acidimicrobiales bacterium]